MTDIQKLARRLPSGFVQDPPPGKHGEYAGHSEINQIALAAVGPFDQFIVREIYDNGELTGVVVRIVAVIDGRVTSVEEVGSADRGSNGERLKKAVSDAFKRCWMRIGLGLHLWAQERYKLDKWLKGSGQAGEE